MNRCGPSNGQSSTCPSNQIISDQLFSNVKKYNLNLFVLSVLFLSDIFTPGVKPQQINAAPGAAFGRESCWAVSAFWVLTIDFAKFNGSILSSLNLGSLRSEKVKIPFYCIRNKSLPTCRIGKHSYSPLGNVETTSLTWLGRTVGSHAS